MKYKNLIINELGKKCTRQFVFQFNFFQVSTFLSSTFDVLLEHIYIYTYFD